MEEYAEEDVTFEEEHAEDAEEKPQEMTFEDMEPYVEYEETLAMTRNDKHIMTAEEAEEEEIASYVPGSNIFWFLRKGSSVNDDGNADLEQS